MNRAKVSTKWIDHRLIPALITVALLWSAQAAAAKLPLNCLVESARAQIGVTLSYDPAYRRLDYPAGDVPSSTGVCTDVIIRAYRALGADLQVLVHEDMRSDFSEYPKNWGLRAPDRNIDHRRVPNLARYFIRHGEAISLDPKEKFLAGDLVTWRLPSGVPHIGIVSDQSNMLGTPLVIHNIGAGTREEDRLYSFEITGHYRFTPAALPARCAAN